MNYMKSCRLALWLRLCPNGLGVYLFKSVKSGAILRWLS